MHVSLLHIFLPNGQVKVLGNVEKQTDRQTESKTEAFVGKGGGGFLCPVFKS